MTAKPLSEVQEDIQKMLLVIRAFTEPGTQGEDLLEEWEAKYGRD